MAASCGVCPVTGTFPSALPQPEVLRGGRKKRPRLPRVLLTLSFQPRLLPSCPPHVTESHALVWSNARILSQNEVQAFLIKPIRLPTE